MRVIVYVVCQINSDIYNNKCTVLFRDTELRFLTHEQGRNEITVDGARGKKQVWRHQVRT